MSHEFTPRSTNDMDLSVHGDAKAAMPHIPDIIPGFRDIALRIEDMETDVLTRMKSFPNPPKKLADIWHSLTVAWADYSPIDFNPFGNASDFIETRMKSFISGPLKQDSMNLLTEYRMMHKTIRQQQQHNRPNQLDWETLLDLHTSVHYYEKIVDLTILTGNSGIVLGLDKFGIDSMRDNVKQALEEQERKYHQSLQANPTSDGEITQRKTYDSSMSLDEFTQSYKGLVQVQ